MSKGVLFQMVIVFLSAKMVLAQEKRTDSLMRVALAAPFDSTRVLLLNDAATELREKDNNIALKYAEEAKQLAIKIGFKRGLGPILENIGWIYYRKGEYSKALEISSQALQINEEFENKKGMAQCLNNLGAIYSEQELYDLGISSFKKAYKIGKDIKNNSIMSRSLNNVAHTFFRTRQLDSARYYAQRSINEQINDKARMAFSNRTLGDVSLEEGNYKEALRYYELSLRTSIELENNFIKSTILYRLGDLYLRKGDLPKAISYLEQNLPLTKKYGYISERQHTYKFLAKVYAKKKDFAKAYEFQGLYHVLNDSITEQLRIEQMAIAQSKYDSEIKNAQIDLLTKNSKTQRMWIYIGIGGLVLLLIQVAILVRNNRRGKIVNKLLSEQNSLINDQKQQLISLNSTKDKLFSIIGHDMRSPVASLRGLMDLVSNEAVTQEEFVQLSKKIRNNLDNVHSDLENLLNWAQAQQKGLKASFERIALNEAVQDKANLLGELSRAKDIKVTNAVPEGVLVYADKNQLGLVIRNLIGNAIKFNHPNGSIKIDCNRSEDKVNISITDTGTGMSQEEIDKLFITGSHFSKPGTENEKGIGLGLLLVKEFVELNHGTINVTSILDKGTTFTFSLKRAD
jgi:two-component system, sensor histidine kinase and response regulator